MQVKDVIKVDGPRIKFPTLCICPSCGGNNAIFFNNETIFDKDLAYEVAIINHGYYLSRWEGENIMNKSIFPKKCSCSCQHEWETENVTMFNHKLTCKKCDYIRYMDSSD